MILPCSTGSILLQILQRLGVCGRGYGGKEWIWDNEVIKRKDLEIAEFIGQQTGEGPLNLSFKTLIL